MLHRCAVQSALIQHHLADLTLKGRSTPSQDRNRAQRSKEGGIMGALFGGGLANKPDLDAEVRCKQDVTAVLL